MCDNKDDCGDNSDEEDAECQKYRKCTQSKILIYLRYTVKSVSLLGVLNRWIIAKLFRIIISIIKALENVLKTRE